LDARERRFGATAEKPEERSFAPICAPLEQPSELGA